MENLTTMRCVGCEGGIPPLDLDTIQTYLINMPGWSLSADQKWISRDFTFKTYYHTMAFVNAIAWMTHIENHHPDIEVGYGHCLVQYSTHAVNGLTKNDFICAAKVTALYNQSHPGE